MPLPLLQRRQTRRSLLRGFAFGALGLTSAALIGCGDDDEPPSPPQALDRDLGEAVHFPLVAGWYRGEEAQYFDFGMRTRLSGTESEVSPAEIFAFIVGMDGDGNPQFVDGQHNVIDVLPVEDTYSDLWDVQLVTVSDGYDPDSIRSKDEVERSGFDRKSAGLLVNCPLVPADSTLETEQELIQGWYRGERVYYPSFGRNPDAAIPILAFATGMKDDGSPAFVEGQRNVIDRVPGDEDYSAFWRVNLVMVGGAYEANSLTDAETILGAGFEIVETDLVVNCPVVSPTTRPQAQSELALIGSGDDEPRTTTSYRS